MNRYDEEIEKLKYRDINEFTEEELMLWQFYAAGIDFDDPFFDEDICDEEGMHEE